MGSTPTSGTMFGSTESTNVKHETRKREAHYTGDCTYCRPNRGCNRSRGWFKGRDGRKKKDTK